jgi:hypothetical protein
MMQATLMSLFAAQPGLNQAHSSVWPHYFSDKKHGSIVRS